MKRLFCFIVITALLTFAVFAEDFAYVHDDAELFLIADEAEIVASAEKVYNDTGLLCVIVTDYGIGDVLSNLPAYVGSASDMVMLTIDMALREFDMYQYNADIGEAAFRVSYDESEDILNGIIGYMSDGEYTDAALLFIDMAEEAFSNSDNFVSGEYDGYEYVDYSYEEFTYMDVLFPFVIGIAIGGISVLCVKGSYKNKVHGNIYPLSQFSNLTLTDSKDNFVTKNIVVTVIPDPPSSSGGGGGLRGGGGARMGGRKF